MKIHEQLSPFTYEAYLSSDKEQFAKELTKAIDKILANSGANVDHAKYFSISDDILSGLQSLGHQISQIDYDGTCNHYGSWVPNDNQLFIIVGFGDDPTEIL